MVKELQELFDGLNTLCETNEAFYFSEQDYNGTHIVRSYTYRLASWSDFQLPYAKDCRGTAFVLNKKTDEWSLFTRAYRKFHNLGEFGTLPLFDSDEKYYESLDYENTLKLIKNKKFSSKEELFNFLSAPSKIH